MGFARAFGVCLRFSRHTRRLKGIMLTPLATGISAGLGAVAGLGLVAGGCAYAAMWPASQLFGRTLIAPRRPGELALTFDDGPNPACTPRLLDILAAQDVRATFFLVGGFAQVQPGLVHRILAAGHLIGNHSWTHPNLALTAANRVDKELARTRETLQQIAGTPIRYFRPPYGARRPHVLRTARKLGMVPVLWNAMTNDWSETSADATAGRLIPLIDRLAHQGYAANIVLHDGNHRQLGADRNPSITAAGQLVARYKATHRFVTLDAWGQKPATET
jgi:peptidoglycan/xylan/chitin deacetylase (PgdA/CDA1 family)